MRWQGGRRSTNVEDRRGMRVGRGAGLGCGSVVIAIVASLIFGVNPLQVLQFLGGVQSTTAPTTQAPGPQQAGADDEMRAFVEVVLASTEDTWDRIFAQAGYDYPRPRLVLYTDAVQSACGFSSAATGPFYCPGDQQIYIDLGFLRELQRLGAPGDFAFAYVIAHEVGHHVQRVTGIEPRVRQLQQRSSRADANQLSVMMELQADCYAGVWGYHARHMLEEGDVEEGLRAAAAIGDDRLQRMSGRVVQPESFTHGSSAQRVQWFRTGFETGDEDACDTFNSAL